MTAPAFTDDQQQEIYQLFGVPRTGEGLVITSLSHIPPTLAQIWTGTYTQAEWTDIVTQMQNVIGNPTQGQANLVNKWLQAYEGIIGPASIMEVSEDGTTKGVLIDNPALEEKCRVEVAKCLGILVPNRGFIDEAKKLYDLSGGVAGVGGSGDR